MVKMPQSDIHFSSPLNGSIRTECLARRKQPFGLLKQKHALFLGCQIEKRFSSEILCFKILFERLLRARL